MLNTIDRFLLVLHFLGLAMGFSVSFSNMIMARLIAAAPPPEKAVLARFPPAIFRVGEVGLAILWLSGLGLVFSKWGGFHPLPWHFHVKLGAVTVVTLAQGYVHYLMKRVQKGEAALQARIPVVGSVAGLSALVAVVFAVVTFD